MPTIEKNIWKITNEDKENFKILNTDTTLQHPDQ
jgi:hypothetical protein